MENHVRSTSFIKKAIALLCVMFTIVGLFGYYNMKPLSSNALATYVSYTVGMGGGTKYYSNSSVGKFTSSASWISVTRNTQSNFTINIAESSYVSSSPQRYGYVSFYNSKGTLLHRITINQTNPYIALSSSSVTMPNQKNGTTTITVQSTISFNYGISDKSGHFYPCSGGMPNTTGALKYTSITVQTKQINKSGTKWGIQFWVKATKYNANRYAMINQASEEKQQEKTEDISLSGKMYYGRYVNHYIKFFGDCPSAESAIDRTYYYNVIEWDMPQANFCPEGWNRNISWGELKRCAMQYFIKLDVPPKSNRGTLSICIDGQWAPYAMVTKNLKGELDIEVFGYSDDHNNIIFHCTEV